MSPFLYAWLCYRTKKHNEKKGAKMELDRSYVEKLYNDSNFIATEMSFYSYADFKLNAKEIKMLYDQLGFRTKKLYLWYVYSRTMSLKQKNMVWDFLNFNGILG